MSEPKDYSYPNIYITDYIDESLPKILARDDSAKHSFRRVETLPAVTEEDLGMKVYLVGRGNFQLVSVDPEPQWKQLSDDTREPAYSDWVIENFQPISNVLKSLAKLTNVSNSVIYFDGPSDIQASPITTYIMNLLAQSDGAGARTALGLGTLATLNAPINGSYIEDGSIDITKINNSFKRELGFTTGDVKLTLKTTADEGWVMMNDGSIGSSTSGATARANSDTYSLFMLLWNIPACTLQTFSGAATEKTTAIQDWSSNKRLLLPKVLGRALAGAGEGDGLTMRVLGSSTGAESVRISEKGNNSIRLNNGTLIQWGVGATGQSVILDQPFIDTGYTVALGFVSEAKYHSSSYFTNKRTTGFDLKAYSNGRQVYWIAIGY